MPLSVPDATKIRVGQTMLTLSFRFAWLWTPLFKGGQHPRPCSIYLLRKYPGTSFAGFPYYLPHPLSSFFFSPFLKLPQPPPPFLRFFHFLLIFSKLTHYSYYFHFYSTSPLIHTSFSHTTLLYTFLLLQWNLSKRPLAYRDHLLK